jgi:hypothetical protein
MDIRAVLGPGVGPQTPRNAAGGPTGRRGRRSVRPGSVRSPTGQRVAPRGRPENRTGQAKQSQSGSGAVPAGLGGRFRPGRNHAYGFAPSPLDRRRSAPVARSHCVTHFWQRRASRPATSRGIPRRSRRPYCTRCAAHVMRRPHVRHRFFEFIPVLHRRQRAPTRTNAMFAHALSRVCVCVRLRNLV